MNRAIRRVGIGVTVLILLLVGQLTYLQVYDADKLGRLSGLAVVTSLIEFGARYPDRAVTSEVLDGMMVVLV